MKKILLGIFIVFSPIIFAQKNTVNVEKTEKVFGYNNSTNSDIVGYEYKFPQKIFEYNLYLNNLSVQLKDRNKGLVILYDIARDSIKWTKNISYDKNIFRQFGDKIVFESNRNMLLDIENGNKKYNILSDNEIAFADKNNKVGIGHKFGNEKILMATNLENGEVLWQKKIKNSFDLDRIIDINDTSLLVISNGLHQIDVNSGKGWSVAMKTSVGNGGAAAGAVLGGVLFGAIGGAIGGAMAGDMAFGIESNLLYNNDFAYIASSEKIAKISLKNGEILWKTFFEKNEASSSYIFEDNRLIYMLNFGYAYQNIDIKKNRVKYGKSFVAAFDKENEGKTKFIYYLGKKEIISDFYFTENNIFLVINDNLKVFSKKQEKIINEKDFDYFDYFIEYEYFEYFINNAEKFVNLNDLDNTKVFAVTKNGNVISIDDELNIETILPSKDLYLNYLNTDNYRFISNNTETFIIDNFGSKIAEISASSDAVLIDNILYDKKDNCLISIDLTEILK
ncbi:MAG: hypothetical protein LBN95_04445 [Prevotellaceae bacterium]|jgi:outer membrane protein assembly factor BamB|nr:hypothetical protein [Prevotellaceae bacterium]